jgi:hypothetical protein
MTSLCWYNNTCIRETCWPCGKIVVSQSRIREFEPYLSHDNDSYDTITCIGKNDAKKDGKLYNQELLAKQICFQFTKILTVIIVPNFWKAYSFVYVLKYAIYSVITKHRGYYKDLNLI